MYTCMHGPLLVKMCGGTWCVCACVVRVCGGGGHLFIVLASRKNFTSAFILRITTLVTVAIIHALYG